MSTGLDEPRSGAWAIFEAGDIFVPRGYEYVSGELIRKTMGNLSSWIAGRTFYRLQHHVIRQDRPDWVFPEGQSYRCFPLTGDRRRSRRADASVVLFDRLPAGPDDEPHIEIPPDIAVEVISPTDRTYDTDDKLADYEAAGIRLVWVVHPVRRSVRIIDRDAGTDVTVREGASLTGGAVLPDFRLPVADIFPPAVSAAGGD